VQVRKIPIGQLNPAAYNPRKDLQPGDPEYEKLKRSIQEFGYVEPIIWNKRTGNIVGGHQRYKVLLDMGISEVDCVVVDLDETKEKALNLALNKIQGDWDYEKLKDLLQELDTGEFDLELTGFDMDEIEELIAQIHVPEEFIEDEVPEPPEEPITKPGDLWILGRHRLLCGDATKKEDVERLMDGKKADMVFTDPPYGMKLDTDYSKMQGNGRKGKTYSKVIGDNEDFSEDLINTIFDNFNYCKEIFLWGVDYYFDLIPGFKKGNLIVWDKTLQTNGDAGYNSEFELLWTKNQHKKEVIHFNWFRYFGLSAQDIKTRVHPTQKPLQVITPFIEKYSDEDSNIVDIYGGSGSTLIACEQLNRICYMMEIDPVYCDVIIKRWENFTGQKAVKLGK
jgi:DNA modification methylase